MAGAGYKLYSTGDVLSASDVNTYLQQQTVMVFASAAARTTALASVLAEGMVTYLKDTDVVEIYTGAAWVSLDDPNAIQNSIVTAKGDLIGATASGTPARLAVGNNGETLVADSSATSGLRYQANFAAGKNKIINGDFYVNQRNFTSTTSNGLPMFDRYFDNIVGNGTTTFSAQTFTAGTAPVSGYEGKNYLQVAVSGESSTSSYQLFSQKIESVRTLAGQSATISFWAKANTGTPNILTYVQQQFGSGGSPSAAVSTYATVTAISTSWVRYSFVITIPSISGKTIGTNNDDFISLTILVSAGSANGAPFTSVGIQNNTFQFWGIQLEAGSVATAFQTATGTIQGELAACQRYYFRWNASNVNTVFLTGQAYTTTGSVFTIAYPVAMRANPTVIEFASLGASNSTLGVNAVSALGLTYVSSTTGGLQATTTGLTAGNATLLLANTSASAYLGIGAEL